MFEDKSKPSRRGERYPDVSVWTVAECPHSSDKETILFSKKKVSLVSKRSYEKKTLLPSDLRSLAHRNILIANTKKTVPNTSGVACHLIILLSDAQRSVVLLSLS
jgi:hypothetical protein